MTDLCKYAIAIQCGPFACVAHENEGEPESHAAKIEERKAQIEREIRRGLRAWPTCNVTGQPVALEWLNPEGRQAPYWFCDSCGRRYAADPVGLGRPPEHDPIEPAILSRWFARLNGAYLPSSECAPIPNQEIKFKDRGTSGLRPSDAPYFSFDPLPVLRVNGKVTAVGGGKAIFGDGEGARLPELRPGEMLDRAVGVSTKSDYTPLKFPHTITEEDVERIKSHYMRASGMENPIYPDFHIGDTPRPKLETPPEVTEVIEKFRKFQSLPNQVLECKASDVGDIQPLADAIPDDWKVQPMTMEEFKRRESEAEPIQQRAPDSCVTVHLRIGDWKTQVAFPREDMKEQAGRRHLAQSLLEAVDNLDDAGKSEC